MTDGDHLKKELKRLNMPITEVSKRLNVARNTIYAHMRSEHITKSVKKKYLELGVNWGRLDRLRVFYEASPLQNPNIRMIPLITKFAYASYMEHWNDENIEMNFDSVPTTEPNDGNYVCFQIKGDSMSTGEFKSIEEDDLFIGRELSRHHWQNKLHLHYAKLWIIHHRIRGIMCKEITHHDVENGKITCHSWNPTYDDFELSLDEVNQLFYYKSITTKRFQNLY